jgi:hypothetical protein
MSMIAQPGLFNNGLALAQRYLILPYQAYYQMPENCTILSPHPTSNQAEHRVMLDCSGDVGRTYRCHPVVLGMPPKRPSNSAPKYVWNGSRASETCRNFPLSCHIMVDVRRTYPVRMITPRQVLPMVGHTSNILHYTPHQA